MAEVPTRISFVASLPPIQSAISMDGHGEGARIKLDIPRSDAGAVLLLQHYFAGKAFQVTIEMLDNKGVINRREQGDDEDGDKLEEGAKRKSKWTTAEKSRAQ